MFSCIVNNNIIRTAYLQGEKKKVEEFKMKWYEALLSGFVTGLICNIIIYVFNGGI